MAVPLNDFRVHTWRLSKYPYLSYTILQRTLNLHQAGTDCLWKRLQCPMPQTEADNCHLFAQDVRKLRVKSTEHVSCHSQDTVRYINDIFHHIIHLLTIGCLAFCSYFVVILWIATQASFVKSRWSESTLLTMLYGQNGCWHRQNMSS